MRHSGHITRAASIQDGYNDVNTGDIYLNPTDRGAIILTMTSSLARARRRRGAGVRGAGGNLRTKSRYE